MTNQQILTKAIQKAVDGGWKSAIGVQNPEYIATDTIAHDAVLSLIFDHYFAKALWGEEWKSAELLPHVPPKDTYRVGTITPCWQFHLQAMVIADDPIKYLGEHL